LKTQTNYRDGRSRSIYVAIHLDGSFVPCGVITFNGTNDVAGFAYSPDYNGPPLDPINLNYRKTGIRSFGVNRRTNNDLLHRVFVDYLPGPWGIQVLQAEFPEIKLLKAAERLHWLGTRTVGSLAFFVKHLEDELPINGMERLEEIRRRSVEFFVRKSDSVTEDRWELDGLSSHGGARPKCIFTDKNGGQWLAKFNVDSDAYNFARVEHGISVLAKHCGINAVETRWLEMSPGIDVLFVRRFDRDGASRPHKVSAFSLMREDIVRAQNEGDYKMLFDLIDQISCDPEPEKKEMFRRMLFNIAVNNSDDHLKNFEVLLDREKGCYTLSPAYDLTTDPYPNPRVTSVFGISSPSLSNKTIEHVLKRLDFDRSTAYEIRDEIVSRVANWKSMFVELGLDSRQIDRLSRAFNYGLRDVEIPSANLNESTPSLQIKINHSKYDI
jgi:serine/threonine-protein kinase HipA